MIDTHVPESELEQPPSRTSLRAERKKVQDDLDTMTKRLTELSPASRKKLALDPAIEEAVHILATMRTGGGMSRQRRYVAKLLRTVDLVALSKALEKYR